MQGLIEKSIGVKCMKNVSVYQHSQMISKNYSIGWA